MEILLGKILGRLMVWGNQNIAVWMGSYTVLRRVDHQTLPCRTG